MFIQRDEGEWIIIQYIISKKVLIYLTLPESHLNGAC
jgi:hypothetical protein